MILRFICFINGSPLTQLWAFKKVCYSIQFSVLHFPFFILHLIGWGLKKMNLI
jgi:hypothetical protein